MEETMNLKMNYNSFIKLKDFSKLLDITAEVTSYNQVNDVLDGKLTINGKYLKKDGVTDDFFTEVLPFSVVFNDKNYHIDDIICTDIDTVSVDGRGIDTTFDIEIEYDEISPSVEYEDFERLQSENSIESIDEIEKEPITLDDIEKIKEEETQKIDKILKSTLNFKDDNLPTEEVIVRGLSDKKHRLKVCYYKNDKELENLCIENKISLNEVFKANKNTNIEQHHRVIIHESDNDVSQ